MKACDNCGTPFEPRNKDQRFCKPACRAAWHRNNKLTGAVKGLRQLTSGGWSVTIHYPNQPNLHVGQKVAVPVTPENTSNTRTYASDE